MQARLLIQTLIKLLVDSVDEDNRNVKFLLVNETIMIASRYESGKSIITAARYKDSELIMTSLIIMKIRFVRF